MPPPSAAEDFLNDAPATPPFPPLPPPDIPPIPLTPGPGDLVGLGVNSPRDALGLDPDNPLTFPFTPVAPGAATAADSMTPRALQAYRDTIDENIQRLLRQEASVRRRTQVELDALDEEFADAPNAHASARDDETDEEIQAVLRAREQKAAEHAEQAALLAEQAALLAEEGASSLSLYI